MIGNMSWTQVESAVVFGITCYFLLTSTNIWVRRIGIAVVVAYLFVMTFILGYYWHLCVIEPEPIKTYL